MTGTRGATDVQDVSGARHDRPIRLLVFTSLYPNAEQPRHGVFVEERLRHLVDSGRIAATVVAPVPWFPSRHPRFGAYARSARVPRCEERFGIRTLHPRYPVIPKLGMNFASWLMYRTLLPCLRRLLRADPGYDLIDAHYLYPDGVAAVALGQRLGRPVVMTARGSDVTLIPRYRNPRRQILRAVAGSAAVVTVSHALRSQLIALGVAAGHVSVLRNGVDLERFRPMSASALRAKLNLHTPVWLTVGNLIELKGVHFVIAALAQVPEATLMVAGGGPEEQHLRDLAHRAGVDGRVRFLGVIAHAELPAYYSAADVMLLASSREGMPNVVLESLACGTPVVATPFAGVDELVNAPEAGEVAEARTAEAILSAWQRLWARRPERAATRRFAEQLGWEPVVEAQYALYAKVLAAKVRGPRTGESA
jgi:glycosyltransferase involved in cell wall biosynthesis